MAGGAGSADYLVEHKQAELAAPSPPASWVPLTMQQQQQQQQQHHQQEVMGPPLHHLPPKHVSRSPPLLSSANGQGGIEQPIPSRAQSLPPASHASFSFGAGYGNPSEWTVHHSSSNSHHLSSHSSSSRPPSYPAFPSSSSTALQLQHAAPHLLAPRPSLHAMPSLHDPMSSLAPPDTRRMRGDGFLLDGDDEDDAAGGLDASLPLQQLERGSSSATNLTAMDAVMGVGGGAGHGDGHYGGGGGGDDGHGGVAPRAHSADVGSGILFNAGLQNVPMQRTVSMDSAPPPPPLVCPSCGEPQGLNGGDSSGSEQSFHAHVTRCFLTHHFMNNGSLTSAVASGAGRPPRTPQATPMLEGSSGPFRKTRSRAASAAAATGSAAELASALARGDGGSPHTHTSTPESHGYHPYSQHTPPSATHLSSTLRALRRTVDQLDVHQRISIMEAFHKLSRVASVEHAQQQQAQQAAAAAVVLGVSASPRGKRLRSHNNSPSPKLKPVEDRVCKDILSLLYSPRITAPHPSPAVAGGGNMGMPSPLVIGLPGAPQSAGTNHAGAHRSVADREASLAAAAADAATHNGSTLHVPSSLLASPTAMDTLELEPSSHQMLQMQLHPPGSGSGGSGNGGSGNFLSVPHSIPLHQPVRSLVESQQQSSMSNASMSVADSVLSSPVPGNGGEMGGIGSDSLASVHSLLNDGSTSALALTGSFVHGIELRGASSPSPAPTTPSGGACSEQTSPSAPTESSDGRSTTGSGGGSVGGLPPPRFPAYCHPSFAVGDSAPALESSSSSHRGVVSAQVAPGPPPSALRESSSSDGQSQVTARSGSSASSSTSSPESPDPNSARLQQECTAEVADKQRMMRRTTAAARG